MPGGTLLSAAVVTAFSVQLKPSTLVELQDRAIRVVDVVDLHRLPSRGRVVLGAKVIAILPRNSSSISLKRSAVASLVRRRVPVLQAEGGSGDITFRVPVVEPPPEQRCVALVRPIRAGQALSREDLAPASCIRTGRDLLRYDQRNGSLRALRNLDAGVPLGQLVTAPDRPTVEAGDKLTLVSRSGPVRITRTVTALQSVRNGQRVFVQDGDGHVEAALLDTRSRGDRQ